MSQVDAGGAVGVGFLVELLTIAIAGIFYSVGAASRGQEMQFLREYCVVDSIQGGEDGVQ